MGKNKMRLLVGLCVLFAVESAQTVSADAKEASAASDFHTGAVKIEVFQKEDAKKNSADLKKEAHILPGQKILMAPSVKGFGADCFVRVKVSAVSEKGKEIPFSSFQGIGKDWKRKGEYIYLTDILRTGKETEIFRFFTLPKDWDQDRIQNDTINIHLTVDAIQSRHFTPDFEAENPWGEVSVQEAKKTEDGTVFQLLEPKQGNGNCRFIVEGEKIVSVPDDFFRDFGNMVPGDTLGGTIHVGNNTQKTETVYLKIQADAKEELLKQVRLTIRSGDGSILYDGTLISDILDEYHYLEAYESGREEKLTFTVSLPKKLDNAYSLEDAKMTWTVRAESMEEKEEPEEKTETWEKPPRDKAAKTGDESQAMLWAVAMLAGGMAFFVFRKRFLDVFGITCTGQKKGRNHTGRFGKKGQK